MMNKDISKTGKKQLLRLLCFVYIYLHKILFAVEDGLTASC